MKRILMVLTLVAFAGFESVWGQSSAVDQPAATLESIDPLQLSLDALEIKNTTVAEKHVADIEDKVAKLYVQALIFQQNNMPEEAVRTVAKLIVLYPSNEKWIAKSELLCAELYVELGLLHAAEVTARQIQSLHEGTDAAQKAAELSIKIDELKNETESEGSVE